MIFRQKKTRSPGYKRRRKGAATVELAVCLPILSLIAIGSFEAASMIFLRQALVQSAYESCKVAIKNDGDQSLARTRAVEVLSFRDITGETITFDPANTDDVPRGTPVTVTISCPGDTNSILPFGPFKNRNIAVSATMIKE